MTNIDLVGSAFSSNKPYLFRAIYEWILDNDGTPYLLVDATHTAVQVPQEHVKDGQIILNVSPNAIQGWFSDNDAISFSARFSGKAQQIYIPMNALLAVYAQENSLGMAFPEALEQPPSDHDDDSDSATGTDTGISDIEEDSGDQQDKKTIKPKTEKRANKKSGKKSHLKVVK